MSSTSTIASTARRRSWWGRFSSRFLKRDRCLPSSFRGRAAEPGIQHADLIRSSRNVDDGPDARLILQRLCSGFRVSLRDPGMTGCWWQDSSSPRPAFAVWPLSKNAPRRGRRSREAGYGTEPLKVFTWRGLPHPAGVLALIARGRRHSRRAASIRARTYGMIMSQHATVSAPIRHRPLPRSPGSRPAFPRRRWPKYRPGRSGVDNSARLFFAVERNQWVGGNVYPRGRRSVDHGT